jgi:hypothetical protein
LIWACFDVRLATIRDAMAVGCAASVADIGRTLRAGTKLRLLLAGVAGYRRARRAKRLSGTVITIANGLTSAGDVKKCFEQRCHPSVA